VKSYLIYGLAAAILFAASATVSLYYLPGKPPAAAPDKNAVSKNGETAGKSTEIESTEKLRPLVKSATPDTEQTALLLQTLRDRERPSRRKRSSSTSAASRWN
jgi:hypothetical protein